MRGKRWRRYESLSISERYTVCSYQASVTVTVPVRMLAPPLLTTLSVLSNDNSEAHTCPPIAVFAARLERAREQGVRLGRRRIEDTDKKEVAAILAARNAAESAPRPPFGLPEVLVGVRTSHLSCGKPEIAQIFTPVRGSFGESRFERSLACRTSATHS